MSVFQQYVVGDLGAVFDGPHATPTRRTSGTKYFLNISSLDSGRLDLTKSDWIDDHDFESWTRRVQPVESDLLFSYETRLGEAALMPPDVDACLGRRMGLLRPNREVVDPRFLLYAWLSPQFQTEIAQRAVRGATVDRIPLTELSSWSIQLPQLGEQRAIAVVLGALDDKIAANRRVIRLAQGLGVSILRSGQLEPRPLSGVATINMGTSPKGEDLNEENCGLPFFQGVRDFGEVYPRERVFTAKPVRTTGARSILFAVRAPVGQTNLAIREAAIGRGLAGLSCSEYPATLYFAMKAFESIWDRFDGGGTVFASVNAAEVRSAELPMPIVSEASKREIQLAALLDRMVAAGHESGALESTRDELLPLLMDGTITVKEATEHVADTTAGVT